MSVVSAYQAAEAEHRRLVRAIWESNYRRRGKAWAGRTYHRRLAEVYRFLIPAGERVLELGCGDGALLASLRPGFGLGVDFSFAAARSAKARYPELHIVVADAQALPFRDGCVAAVALSDLVGDLWDVQAVLAEARRVATPRGRLFANFYSRVWEPPLWLAQRLGWARRRAPQNWITAQDLNHFLRLSQWEPLRRWTEILCPFPLPLLEPGLNRWLAKIPPGNALALTNFVAARSQPRPRERATLSVIVPVRNEEGHVTGLFESLQHLDPGDEVLFVEGASRDRTYAAVVEGLAARPGFPGRLLRQPGCGKADAVRAGFAAARGDLLVILDGDLTVAAEMLPRFREALQSGAAEFANGVRLVYPVEKNAMRPLNFLANKFFSLAFSSLLGQAVKDTLCGTKALWRSDYERIARGRAYFGDFDPFGDFDLLFGAAKLNLKMVDIPVRYLSRRYGAPNIARFRDGWRLLRMVAYAARRLKFT